MNKSIFSCFIIFAILAYIHVSEAQWKADGTLDRNGAHGRVSYRGRRWQVSGHVSRGWRGGSSYGVSASWSWGKKRSKLPAPPAPCDFNLYDIDDDGHIEFLEFDASTRHINLEQVMEVFKTLDSDDNGKISKDEFYKETKALSKQHIFRKCKKQ